MATPLDKKSSVTEIRERFDKDVDRFADLDSGQTSTIDAPLVMELITQAALLTTPEIENVLDIGCGAGNNTIKLLQTAGSFNCHLVDLSLPMLKKARQRCNELTSGKVTIYQADFRELNLPEKTFNVILAAAVLHHLRDDDDWERVFRKIYNLTAHGGSVWITDLVNHENHDIEKLMRKRYGDHLIGTGGVQYKESVFEYIDKEDSPRPLTYQLDLLRKVGFKEVEVLHKNSCFAAFGALKAEE